MNSRDYIIRRKKLAKAIGKGSVAILPAAQTSQRSRDTKYKYRPDSDFYYYTGFSEPESLMILAPGRSEGEFILLVEKKDPLAETWEGHRPGPKGAIKDYGADQSFSIDHCDAVLSKILKTTEKIFFTLGNDASYDQKITNILNSLRTGQRQGVSAPGSIISLESITHELRSIKSATEIKLMRKAAKIGVEAHFRVMKKCQENLYEYQLESEILHQFGQYGATASYDSIVASGSNACTLHYINNRSKLKNGELLLTDAGCEFEMYASDITRTIPISGVFTEEQKAIYSIVLETQKKAIESVKPGQTFKNLQNNAIKSITKGLQKLGILSGNIDKLIANEAYKPFYMHGIGHWLGMDVHDVGSYGNPKKGSVRKFEPGMVLTIEPGIYISSKNRKVEKKWRGIGIRIEDDILVKKNGNEILTHKLSKEIDDIESIMANH